MSLSRDQIFAADDLRIEKVECPEWGGEVYVKLMSGSERDRFEISHTANPDKDIRARLIVSTVCDCTGVLLFTPADTESIGGKSSAVLDRIFSAAIKLNRIRKEDVDDLGNASPPTP